MTEQEFTRRMLRTVFTVTAVAIAVQALWAARDALMLIYVSALIAMGFSPLVGLIERPKRADGSFRIPRVFAILTIYLVIVAIVIVIGSMIVPPLVEQATTLWANAPEYFNRLNQWLLKHNVTTHRVTLQEAVQNAPAGENAVSTVVGAVWGLIGGVFGLITIVILSFYFLIEAESIFMFITRFVTEPRRAMFATAAREAVIKVSAWLRAQLVLAGVMGVFAAIGLAFLGVPYFYVVALIAAIGETIPIVGPIIGGVTAVAVAITVSPKLAITVGVYFLVLHQLEANILVPKIMERRVGVSPVAVMIALLVGGSLMGLVGAILAIPTAAILSVAIEEFALRQREMPTVHRAAR